uniref:Conserved oligomeric Golgi complex subunit 5 n=1 Tax=Macrostomum lignano TaxID=282301 RepID=A0A1I8GMW3_9PLAT
VGSVAASGAPHPQLATCLHAVFCLGRLDDCIVDLAGRVRSDLRTRIRSALDMSSLMQKTPFVSGSGQAAYGSGSGGGGGPPGRANLPAGQSAAYSQALWSGLDALNEEAISGAQFLASLRRILAKKRDPNTQRPLSDLLSPAASEAISPAGFADWLSDCLRDSLANAASASAFLKHAFEGEYPRLLKSANDLSTRLAAVDEELPLLGRAHLASFEAAYLSSRLFDPVDAMFSGGQKSLNSEIEIRRIVEAMTSELTFTQVDQDLLLKIAKNVVKTVQFVCRKAEATRVADATASQVLGPPTEGQQ